MSLAESAVSHSVFRHIVAFDVKTGNNNLGHITIRLFTEEAPNNAMALYSACHDGSLDGALFSRITPGFLCELSLPRKLSFSDEAIRGRSQKHTYGACSLGRFGPGETQIAPVMQICCAAMPHLDGHHQVIGHVTQGLDVLDKLQRYGSLPLGECSQRIEIHNCKSYLDD